MQSQVSEGERSTTIYTAEEAIGATATDPSRVARYAGKRTKTAQPRDPAVC